MLLRMEVGGRVVRSASGFDDETVGRVGFPGHVEERTPTAAERT
jgi:hypothetical protein